MGKILFAIISLLVLAVPASAATVLRFTATSSGNGELGFIDYDSSIFDGTANQRVTNDNILDIRFVDPVTGLVIDMAGPSDQSTIFDSTGALPTVVGGVGFTGVTPDARMFVVTANTLTIARNDSSFTVFRDVVWSTKALGAVPEPATWAFMIIGFGAIGGAMRRRRKSQVHAGFV